MPTNPQPQTSSNKRRRLIHLHQPRRPLLNQFIHRLRRDILQREPRSTRRQDQINLNLIFLLWFAKIENGILDCLDIVRQNFTDDGPLLPVVGFEGVGEDGGGFVGEGVGVGGVGDDEDDCAELVC